MTRSSVADHSKPTAFDELTKKLPVKPFPGLLKLRPLGITSGGPNQLWIQHPTDTTTLIVDLTKPGGSFTTSKDQTILTQRYTNVYGILGSLPLTGGCALAVVTEAEEVAAVGKHIVMKVTEVEILVQRNGLLGDDAAFLKLFEQATDPKREGRNLYFSWTYDLTASVQVQVGRALKRTSANTTAAAPQNLWEHADPQYCWNKAMNKDIAACIPEFALPVIQGFVGQTRQAVDTGPTLAQATVTLIARRSTNRVGTRHWRRGADSSGHVANFVESEQILEIDGNVRCVHCVVQIRGSIPLLWSHVPNIKYKPKLEIGDEDDCSEATEKHFQMLVNKYKGVVAINLTGSKPGSSEGKLTKGFRQAMELLPEDVASGVHLIEFDFHKQCGAKNYHVLQNLWNEQLKELYDATGALYYDAGVGAESLATQVGVFRTNCVDCLDRTNVVQSMIAEKAIEDILQRMRLLRVQANLPELMPDLHINAMYGCYNVVHHAHNAEARLEDEHPKLYRKLRCLWADHGDAISTQYAGTGALKSGFVRTGKRTLMGFADDGYKSLKRYYLNNFADGTKQDALDLFSGRFRLVNGRRFPDKQKGSPTPLLLVAGAAVAYAVARACLAARLPVDSLRLPSVEDLVFVAKHVLVPLGVAFATLKVVAKRGKKLVDRPCLCPEDVQPWVDEAPAEAKKSK
ncbi:unnamed protein product [Pedinophyceae sp. YPF-701]|nr:unnamed protein product [Pedinophyceae sp. YPF-701]